MEKYEISDYQWKQIKDFIPPKMSKCGRARRDPRELINANNMGIKNRSTLVCTT